MSDGTYIIYVNNQEYAFRIRFTIAHEIGHFILGHDSKLQSGRISQEEAEAEADFLQPNCLFSWEQVCIEREFPDLCVCPKTLYIEKSYFKYISEIFCPLYSQYLGPW